MMPWKLPWKLHPTLRRVGSVLQAGGKFWVHLGSFLHFSGWPGDFCEVFGSLGFALCLVSAERDSSAGVWCGKG